MKRSCDNNESLKDHERMQALVKEKRRKQEERRRREDLRLRNWGRGDLTIRPLEAFVVDRQRR